VVSEENIKIQKVNDALSESYPMTPPANQYIFLPFDTTWRIFRYILHELMDDGRPVVANAHMTLKKLLRK
jgi:hypothetical protein